MGDAFKKVQAGQRIAITAEAYNAFIDAAQAVREHKQLGTKPWNSGRSWRTK